MGIRRQQAEGVTSPPPEFGKKRKERQILNYKKHVNKITPI